MNIANFLTTPVLKDIYERLLLYFDGGIYAACGIVVVLIHHWYKLMIHERCVVFITKMFTEIPRTQKFVLKILECRKRNSISQFCISQRDGSGKNYRLDLTLTFIIKLEWHNSFSQHEYVWKSTNMTGRKK